MIRVSTTQLLKLWSEFICDHLADGWWKKINSNQNLNLSLLWKWQTFSVVWGIFHTECHSLKLFGNRKEDVRIQRNRDSEMMTVPAQMMSLFQRTPKLTVRYHELWSHIKKNVKPQGASNVWGSPGKLHSSIHLNWFRMWGLEGWSLSRQALSKRWGTQWLGCQCKLHIQAKRPTSPHTVTSNVEYRGADKYRESGSALRKDVLGPLKGYCAVPGKQRLETCREALWAAQSLSCWWLDKEKHST